MAADNKTKTIVQSQSRTENGHARKLLVNIRTKSTHMKLKPGLGAFLCHLARKLFLPILQRLGPI